MYRKVKEIDGIRGEAPKSAAGQRNQMDSHFINILLNGTSIAHNKCIMSICLWKISEKFSSGSPEWFFSPGGPPRLRIPV